MVDKTFKVIGVIKNYHFEPLHNLIRPVLIRLQESQTSELVIKISPKDISKTISSIQEEWNGLSPNRPFNYHFLDDRLAEQYISEQRQSQTIIYLTVIAIFIACLGLFGLSSFIAEQQRKEIGIRKVFGASARNITVKLSRELTQWIIIANVIAWPFAYFVMKKWLETFAYRNPIHVSVFIIAGLIALGIALLTVSFQTVRAANTNPAEVMEYE